APKLWVPATNFVVDLDEQERPSDLWLDASLLNSSPEFSRSDAPLKRRLWQSRIDIPSRVSMRSDRPTLFASESRKQAPSSWARPPGAPAPAQASLAPLVGAAQRWTGHPG